MMSLMDPDHVPQFLTRSLSQFGLRLRPRRVIAHPSRTWSGLAAALVVGALPALAFPAPSWWWLAWFGIVPLLLVVRAAPTTRAAVLRAWCGMAGYILATQYGCCRVPDRC